MRHCLLSETYFPTAQFLILISEAFRLRLTAWPDEILLSWQLMLNINNNN